jgi:hypothetical protein
MGYSVYWANGRWQGYGIPAYCDYPGCSEEIDRGMRFQHEEDLENGTPSVFVCNKHQETLIEEIEVDYDREHPEWLKHILTDESWELWREENPEIVSKYKKLLIFC